MAVPLHELEPEEIALRGAPVEPAEVDGHDVRCCAGVVNQPVARVPVSVRGDDANQAGCAGVENGVDLFDLACRDIVFAVQPPARACGESALARPELLVEITVIAAE